MTITITANSPDETRGHGRRLAPLLTAGDVVVLSGRLGSGKTLFVSGVAEGLGIAEQITSPTFLIAKTYRNGFLPLLHADVYRLGSVAEFDDLALIDQASDGALMIEWGAAVADAARSELRGRDLICYCKPEACHADVLVELANRD